MSKDELWDLALHLQEELETVKKQRHDLHLETDRAQASWETTMKNLGEKEAELRNRRREMEEAMERRREEITVYKQKLKHVLSEQSSTITELKVDGAASLVQHQHQHAASALELHRQVHVLQADCREKQLEHETLIKDLVLKHYTEMIAMKRDYEDKVHEMEFSGDQQRQTLVARELMRLKEATDSIDNKMRRHVTTLTEDHNMRLNHMYAIASQKKMQSKGMSQSMVQITVNLLLKQEEQELKLELSENERLREKLSDLEQKWDELQRRMQQPTNDKDLMARYHLQLKVVAREHTDLSVKLELLRQAIKEVERERDELQRKQTETILDVQQKSGLKRMLLERKIAKLTETLEKQQARLYAALSISSSDPETRCNASKNLKELMESKDKIIAALQEEIAQYSKEYDELLHDTKESSSNLLYDSLFKPSKQILQAARDPSTTVSNQRTSAANTPISSTSGLLDPLRKGSSERICLFLPSAEDPQPGL
ncbi:dynein regulatory complex subunit 4 isoform X2 [Kryptolebias marmoratus]|nr:dynein regulatory complex subunit 4 isoform X2 [Kryptolebias marmoratus]